MYRPIIAMVAGMALVAAPIAASASPANPASALSIAGSVRTGTATSNASRFHGAEAFYALLVVAGIAAIVALGTRNNKPKSP